MVYGKDAAGCDGRPVSSIYGFCGKFITYTLGIRAGSLRCDDLMHNYSQFFEQCVRTVTQRPVFGY